MSYFYSKTQANIDITSQHLQKAQNAVGSTAASLIDCGTNLSKTLLSVASASTFGYLINKTICKEVVGNLPILAAAAYGGVTGSTLLYKTAETAAKFLVLHPMISFSLCAGYSFFTMTDGAQHLKNTASAIGGVISNGSEVVKECYKACNSGLEVIDNAAKSYFLESKHEYSTDEHLKDYNNSSLRAIDHTNIIDDGYGGEGYVLLEAESAVSCLIGTY